MTVITEVHAATVTANQDPEQRGRIRVACAAILGSEDNELPNWCEPIFEWGWFVVPDVGEIVDIEVASASSDDEVLGQISISNLSPRWRSRYWGGSATEVSRPVPADFKTNYGKRRGFATPGGHIMMFDDTEGKKKWSVTWKGGDNEYCYMAFDENGSFTVGNKKGSLLYLNAKDGEISIVDEHGNSISTASTGVKLIDKTGNLVEMKDGAIQVLGQGAVTVQAKNVTLDGGLIELVQGATDFMLKGTTFMQLFMAHTHPTAMGPSGPPIPTGAEATALSLIAKVG